MVVNQAIPLELKGYPPLRITSFEYERARPREGLQASVTLLGLEAQNEQTGKWEGVKALIVGNINAVHWKEIYWAIEGHKRSTQDELLDSL